MSTNASGATLMAPLAAACRTGGDGRSGALVDGVDGNEAAHKPIHWTPRNSSQSSSHPLPALRQPVSGEWRGIPLPQQPQPRSGNALRNAAPHMMRGKNGGTSTGCPPMMPHVPPPGAYCCCSSPRPAPSRMQKCGPPPHVGPKTPSRADGRVDWSAIPGSSGPCNSCALPSQARWNERVMPVARGPQPTSVEPTRLMNGKKIKDVERQQQQAAETRRKQHNFIGPAKGANGQRKEQPQQPQRHKVDSRNIKTTVGNDESWIKGLTYSTWVDSPKGLSIESGRGGPYKRRPKTSRKSRKDREGVSRDHMGKSSLLMEALRNLFC
ncbi:hypothetical protein LSCM1_06445 [Leishmania martiniquensis]|uniref:Uncharacterized protein n=1 Tax=Leishmania martiniquensis TaxID=1580590 RepID=A0A836GVS2_9TRYP|nr:hypothetical protein LSCM1_06445 [Leishmania martiniquensis]